MSTPAFPYAPLLPSDARPSTSFRECARAVHRSADMTPPSTRTHTHSLPPHRWDEDGDGLVSKPEFRRALPMLGLHATAEAIDGLFDTFDRDGGGQIDFRELNRHLRRDVKAEKKPRVVVREAMEEILDYKTLRKQVREGLLNISDTRVEEAVVIPENPTLTPIAKILGGA